MRLILLAMMLTSCNPIDYKVRVVDPCGAQTSDDVVIIMKTDSIVARFINSGGTPFELKTGTYITNDGSNCKFEVTSRGTILHTINGTIHAN